jgi:hypothetical protein
MRYSPRRYRCALEFGHESKLSSFEVQIARRDRASRCFLRLASRTLKVFRTRMEFESGYRRR